MRKLVELLPQIERRKEQIEFLVNFINLKRKSIEFRFPPNYTAK